MAAIVLTQPRPRVEALAQHVRQAGFVAVALTFQQLDPIEASIERLSELIIAERDRLVFVSPSAVNFAQPALARLARLCPHGIAVVGPGTAAAMREVCPALTPIQPAQPPFDADALTAMPAMQADAFDSLVVVRGEHGREDWIEAYRAAGKAVTVIELYRRVDVQPDASPVAAVGRLANRLEPTLLMVSSVGLAERLARWPFEAELAQWLRRQPCMVSHPRVASHLRSAGFTTMLSPSAGVSMLDAAIQWAQNSSAASS